jgi:hypothetical protein
MGTKQENEMIKYVMFDLFLSKVYRMIHRWINFFVYLIPMSSTI